MTTQCVSFTDSSDRQIEPNLVVENIFSMDSFVENLSQALPSKVKLRNILEISTPSTMQRMFQLIRIVCVDCLMEECQDESS